MLDAEWCPLNDIPKVLDYDLGIVIIPKNNPQVDLDFLRSFVKCSGYARRATLVLSRLSS